MFFQPKSVNSDNSKHYKTTMSKLENEIKTRSYHSETNSQSLIGVTYADEFVLLQNNPVTKLFIGAINSPIHKDLSNLLEGYGHTFICDLVGFQSKDLVNPTDSQALCLLTTPLRLAIHCGKMSAVKFILTSLNYDLTSDSSILAMATELSREEESTVDYKECSRSFSDAGLESVRTNKNEGVPGLSILLELLKCKNINPNGVGGTHTQSPIYYAINNKNTNTINILLDLDIDFAQKLPVGISLLEFCIFNKYPNTFIKKILSHKNFSLSKSDIDSVCKFGSVKILNDVMSTGKITKIPEFDYGKLFENLLSRYDVGTETLELTKQAIGVERFNSHLKTILISAIKSFNLTTVEYVLTNIKGDTLGLDDNLGRNALLSVLTTSNGQAIMPTYGLGHTTSSPDEITKMIMHYINDNLSSVDKIHIINQQTLSQKSPIMLIVEKGDLQLLKFFHQMFRSVIEIGAADAFKMVLDTIKSSNLEMFELLLDYVPVTHVDSCSMSICMHALRLGRIEFARKIISNPKFDVTQTDALGRNILSYMLEHKYGKTEADFILNPVSTQPSRKAIPEDTDDWFSTQPQMSNQLSGQNYMSIPNVQSMPKYSMSSYGASLGALATTGTSKNSTHDIRGDVHNPKTIVSPWMNSTIEPDTNIRSLGVDEGLSMMSSSICGISGGSDSTSMYASFDATRFRPVDLPSFRESTNIMTLIQDVLAKGVEPNMFDACEHTPLIYTIDNLDYETFSLLLKTPSFDPNFKLSDGRTYCMYIIDKMTKNYNNQHMIYFLDLLKHPKLDINAVDYVHNTLLMYVCQFNRINLLPHLLKIASINLEAKNYKRETALMIVLKSTPPINWNKVKSLVTSGADYEFYKLRSSTFSPEDFFIFENIIRS